MNDEAIITIWDLLVSFKIKDTTKILITKHN